MEAININDFNNKKIDEADVITRIIGGEKELFEILLRRNNQKLYRVVRTYLKDESEIEDVMQNSYIKAYTKLYQFKLEASFSTWLIRIGINEALSRLNEKRKILHLNGRYDDGCNIVLEIKDERESNPQDKMMEREAKYLLEKAIDNLDVKYREVYVLKEVEEMSIKEVAIALNISASNVKVRAHRAKVMLKENLFELSSIDNSVFEFGFSRCDRITENVMSRI